MPHADFVHLRVHSAYSLSEGAIKVKELIALCKAERMPAVAIADTGNVFGALEFSAAAAEAGVQPILGCQVWVRHEGDGLRHLKAPSFTLPGVKGTPKVMAALFFVILMQLVFTYAPFMQAWFGSAPLGLVQLLQAVLAGVLVLCILEVEKFVLRRFHLEEKP